MLQLFMFRLNNDITIVVIIWADVMLVYIKGNRTLINIG